MKFFEKYFDNFLFVLAVFLGLANFNNAHANTETPLGNLPVPTSVGYTNSFVNASGSFLDASGSILNPSGQFYDAYYFTIPEAFATSVTTTVNVSSFIGISGLEARLFSGHSNTSVTVGDSLISRWAPMVNPIPGVSVETVVLSPTNPFLAGNYTLQVRGTVNGSGGGSYAGTLNLTPVPEAETYAMFLAGLGLMGFISRRRKIGM